MDDRELAKVVWKYMILAMPLEKADVSIVLSSIDPRVAEYSVELWRAGWAPKVLFSGTGSGHAGDLLATHFNKPESEYFADVARARGLPESAILVESQSRNTGENARFSFSYLQSLGLPMQKIIVVTKSYMERRAYATFKKQWPDPETALIISSPPISFENYFNADQPFEKVVHIMLGDLQRIKEYPALGFQIPQVIPQEVTNAAEELVRRGYSKHLLPV